MKQKPKAEPELKHHPRTRQPEGYANTLKGAALYCVHQWELGNAVGVQKEEASELTRGARMAALRDVLLQMTGRRIGTTNERAIIDAVIDGMAS